MACFYLQLFGQGVDYFAAKLVKGTGRNLIYSKYFWDRPLGRDFVGNCCDFIFKIS